MKGSLQRRKQRVVEANCADLSVTEEEYKEKRAFRLPFSSLLLFKLSCVLLLLCAAFAQFTSFHQSKSELSIPNVQTKRKLTHNSANKRIPFDKHVIDSANDSPDLQRKTDSKETAHNWELNASKNTEARHVSVLIARTVGRKEWPLLSEDLLRVSSAEYRNGEVDASHCDALLRAQTKTENGKNSDKNDDSAFFTSLDAMRQSSLLACVRPDLNRISVSVSWLLFIYDASIADDEIDELRHGVSEHSGGRVEIEVVKHINATKLMFWFEFLTAERLLSDSSSKSSSLDYSSTRYDYVWLCDGDLRLFEMKWFDFWKSMLFFRPLMAQPSISPDIGKLVQLHESKAKTREELAKMYVRSTYHPILTVDFDALRWMWKVSPQLLAAEVSFIEVMAPIFRTDAWLTVSREFWSDDDIRQRTSQPGASWCIDHKWCHIARGKLRDVRPKFIDSDINATDLKHGRQWKHRPWFYRQIAPALIRKRKREMKRAKGKPKKARIKRNITVAVQSAEYMQWLLGKGELVDWESMSASEIDEALRSGENLPTAAGCMVFYHTPVVHYDYRTLHKDAEYKEKGRLLCGAIHHAFPGKPTSDHAFRGFYASDLMHVVKNENEISNG